MVIFFTFLGGTMFTVDELLSKRNQNNAFTHLSTKKEGSGPDGMRLSELSEYWKINHEKVEREIKEAMATRLPC